jgi:hypothetical protein
MFSQFPIHISILPVTENNFKFHFYNLATQETPAEFNMSFYLQRVNSAPIAQ